MADIHNTDVIVEGYLNVAYGVQIVKEGSGNCGVKIGAGATGDRVAYFDCIGDDTYPFGFRAMRSAGANGTSQFTHRGTGNLSFRAKEAAKIQFLTDNVVRFTIEEDGDIIAAKDLYCLDLQVDDHADIAGNVVVGGQIICHQFPVQAPGVVAPSSSPLLLWSDRGNIYIDNHYIYLRDADVDINNSLSVAEQITSGGDIQATGRFKGSELANTTGGILIDPKAGNHVTIGLSSGGKCQIPTGDLWVNSGKVYAKDFIKI